MTKKRCTGVLTFLLLAACLSTAQVPKPEEVLGFKVGTARQMADMNQIIDYFQKLEQASDRVIVREVGKTTEGNPFIVAIITSSANHRELEKFRVIQQKLADPRTITENQAEEYIANGKTVVMINCSIHASEIGASQMSIALAYDLAVSNDAATRHILDNVILLLVPMHNPDGIQMVADYYKKTLGTPYEGRRMPWLYQKYVGHDNNRDWYMFTQKETQLTITLHNAWHPHIILDMHQMGSRGARIFVPPYVDPYEPNVDPILRQEVAMMGTFIATELTAEGKGGVIHSAGFDAWTPARAYHHYHGGIRILTELASVNIATPVTIPFESLSSEVRKPSVRMPLPWMGGEWTLRDIVDYDYSAARAVLTNAAGLRRNWLRNFYRIHQKAVLPKEKPFAFLIPEEQADLPSAVWMMKVLQMGGVEIHRASRTFSTEGKAYPTGTSIIYMAQPYGGYAKALLEKQVYPEIRETPNGPLKTPYDVVAHTLPLLMGVETVTVDASFSADADLMESIKKPEGEISGENDAFGYVWGYSSNEDVIALNRLLKKGYEAWWMTEAFTAGGREYVPGTMMVAARPGLRADLQEMVKSLCVRFAAVAAVPQVKTMTLKPVRLGLYKSWTASMDEGWTRWVLEQYELPYESVLDKDIRAGELHDRFDVLILPDMDERSIIRGLPENAAPAEYTGGIGEVGVAHIEKFVKAGGTLITLNQAAQFAVNRLHLGVTDVVRRVPRDRFYVPGSILKGLNRPGHPITFGFGRDAALFFRRSPVFSVSEGTGVVDYPSACFLSGWITGEEHLSGRSAIVDVPYEKGRVILIGFPVLYRGQSHGTFRYLFNAVYYGASGRLGLNRN